MKTFNKRIGMYIGIILFICITMFCSKNVQAKTMPKVPETINLDMNKPVTIGVYKSDPGKNNYYRQSIDWIYCVDLKGHMHQSEPNYYNVIYKIEIDGAKAISSYKNKNGSIVQKSCTSKKNAKFAYILAAENYPYGRGGEDPLNIATRQKAVWYYWNEWVRETTGITTNFFKKADKNAFLANENEYEVQNLGTDGNEHKLLANADNYANSINKENKINITGNDNITMSGVNGSYKLTFGGNVDEITVTFSDNTTEVIKRTSNNFPIFKDSNRTERINISDIKSNKTFYFVNKTGKEIKSIKIHVKDTEQAKKIYGAEIYILEGATKGGRESQRLIAVSPSERNVSPEAEKVIEVKNNYGSLTINKVSKDTNENIGGVSLKVYAILGSGDNLVKGWLQPNGTLGNYSTSQTYVTNNNTGSVTISKLIYGKYYVYEIGTNENYDLEIQRENLPDSGDTTNGFAGKNEYNKAVYLGYKAINKNAINVTQKYYQYSTKLKITKVDVSSAQGEKKYLKDVEVKIYTTNMAGGASGWVRQLEPSKKIEYTTYANATTFKTNDKGEIEIKGIKQGTYYVYETKAAAGYDIKVQDGYKQQNPGSSQIANNIDWVYLGNMIVNSSTKQNEKEFTNNKYTKIRGKVWLERQIQTKTDISYNNIYDNGVDELLSGIQVELVDKSSGTPVVVATTRTQADGTYVFDVLNNNSKILYDNLYKYYVRFLYDKENYITVAADLAENKSNVSRALVSEITENDLDDDKLKGVIGYAITNPNATGNTDGLARYYSYDSSIGTYCVKDINLGLMKKIKPEYSINQSIEYVKIVRGNYTFKYKYRNQTVIVEEENKLFPSVQLQNSSRSFTQPIYPSDIKYNIANGLTSNDSNAYKVYVVYKIDVTNNTALDIENLYQEKTLYLTELVNDYDGNRFEISNEVLNGDDTEISNDFGLWSDEAAAQASGTKTARFNIGSSNKLYKVANKGISPKETETTYIQFKVKDEALTELLDKETLQEAPTVAKSKGYHKYTRIDNSWKDNMSRKYEHKSISEDKKDAELFLKWTLSDTRTVSGTVFEDSKVSQLDGEDVNSREHERIGDGKFTDGEKTLKDVWVSLIDASNNETASLYDGELIQDPSTGKWSTNKEPAVVKVDENGNYALKGIVPGRYYLKFTYGNGKTKIKDLAGNDVNITTKIEDKEINSNYYKSTILTGPADTATSSNEKTWFLGNIDTTYSVATDNTITYYDKNGNSKPEENIITSRTTSTKEMNYTSSQDKAVIEAISPNIDIQFEYVENPEIQMNTGTVLKTNCTGMYFGIIERPHVEIKLSKEISNIRLTLSNGTTIINGDPRDQNVSESLTSMNDSYAKIEMDNPYLYGSSAIVTYNLTATNDSELDYATESYYKKGEKGTTEPVTTTITKVIDYLSNNSSEYVANSENVKLSNNSNDYEDAGYKKADYFDQNPDVRGNNEKYKNQLLIPNEEKLMPTNAGTGNNKTSYSVTVNKLISNLDDNLGWESYSEIIGLKNVTYTAQYTSHSGNYKAGDTEITPNTTSEPDNANATIAITPSTGADKSYTKYIIAGIALITLASGIIIIKKYV